MIEKQTCSIGLWNSDIPEVSFDEKGISNYARLQYKLIEMYPRGEKGEKEWGKILEQIKGKSKKGKYDCVVGLSGGVDSSYLLYLVKNKYKLNPLAVMLDNGWISEIAKNNIHSIIKKLDVDLDIYKIDYNEINDLNRSYMFASLPWIDAPTDNAIKAAMYEVALKHNIKYIFRGNDFRSEGIQPKEWTHSDNKQLKFIHKKYGKLKKLRTYPYLPFWKIIYAGYFRKIKDIRPFYYVNYSKKEAMRFLENELGWKYYGGHHHDNVYTKFVMSYWLPEKFSIDKRFINLSAQIISGEISRDEGLKQLSYTSLTKCEKDKLKNNILTTLDFTNEEFEKIMQSTNKTYRDYPNSDKLISIISKYLRPFIKLVYKQKPLTFVQMEMKKDK